MKTKLMIILLCSLFVYTSAEAQWTMIPDNNFEQALIDLGIDDVLDGKVLTANVENITGLDVTDKNISYLTGIEAFISLQFLQASNNFLQAINTSTMPELEILIAMVNEITTLDLSQNTSLKRLLLNNNKLTEIDVSNNPQLEELVVGANELSSIDVSNNQLLKDLFLMENQQLTSIDVSSNPLLERLLLRNCGISQVDLSNNIHLKYLDVDNNQLSSLDLSNNPEVEGLVIRYNGLLNNVNLKNGENQQLTTFWAKNCPNLTCVQVDDAAWSEANWTEIDPQMYFSENCGEGSYTLIPDNSFEQALIDLGIDDLLDGKVLTESVDTVTTLNVENKNIAELTGIEAFTSLLHLSCGINQISSLELSNYNLKTLLAYQNLLTTFSIQNLPNLEVLDITTNQFSNLDISDSPKLKELFCVDAGLTSLDLSDSPSLENVTVYENSISTLNVENCTSLKSIAIWDNQLTQLQLATNLSLESIGIWRNQLVSLDLSNNPNIKIIAVNSNQLEELKLRNGNNSIIEYFVAIENPNLTCIEVDDVVWSEANWTQIDPQMYFSEFCGATGDDSDGDGVPDAFDDYPMDDTRAFDNYFPAAGYGSLGFEDLWPGMGDYDFNDVVVDYQFHCITNAQNKVAEVKANFVLKASGASLRNGFGFNLAEASQYLQNNLSEVQVSGYHVTEAFVSLMENGFESGQSQPTIIVFDDFFNVMEHPGTGLGINTELDKPFVEFDTLQLAIQPSGLQFGLQDFKFEYWNPFIIVNNERGKEVHLPDYPPTDMADLSIFGTYDDNSNPGTGRYYKTANNLPWAIHVVEEFDWPLEKVSIVEAYRHFFDWAKSAGDEYENWYKDLNGYRDEEKLYIRE